MKHSRLGLILALATLASSSPPARSTAAGTAPARRDVEVEVPPEREAHRPRWTADYFAAVDEARRRNCPVVVMISSDESEGFRTVWNHVYSKPEFAPLTDEAIFVAAFDGEEHACKDRTVDGTTEAWCLLFDLPCRHHRAAHQRAYSVFVKQAFQNPLHAILDPDGIELARVQGHQVRLDTLKTALKEAKAKIEGPSLGYAGYREQMAAMKEIVDLRQKKGWGRQIKALTGYVEETVVVEGMKDYAAELERSLLREGRDRLDEARALLEQGKAKEAKKATSSVLRDFRGTPVYDEARELKKKIDDA